MLRSLATSRTVLRHGAVPARTPLRAGPSRYSSTVPKPVPIPTPVPKAKPLPMPEDMPREDYIGPAAYAVNFIGRTIKYIVYGTVGLSLTAYLGFEGMHAYIEHYALAAPSRADDSDEFAWADENQAWTGGASGGTDPRLGWKGRHALRGAWICWEWGAGDAGSSISKYQTRHPSFPSHSKGVASGNAVNRVDRGYELADEYFDAAIRIAEAKGITFPPNLPGARLPGPPVEGVRGPEADPTACDLLTLKAGVLERMGTPDTIDHARELYERVAYTYADTDLKAGPVKAARAMRLAHKLGDLAQRSGDTDEAQAWWSWGLARAGMGLPTSSSSPAPSSAWWSFGGKKAAPPATTGGAVPESQKLPAPIVRAAVSILVSASAAAAQSGSLNVASSIQSQALSLLPPRSLPATPLSVPGPGQGASGLQSLWEVQRRSLLHLHAASVAHALRTRDVSPLEMSAQVADETESLLSILNPILPVAFTQPRGNPCAAPAKRLTRDTLTTGAEAYFTEAALLERSAREREKKDKSDALHRLEHAAESYERAMSLSAAEEDKTPAAGFGDEDAIGRGEVWTRYWKGYVRCRERMVRLVEEGGVPPKHA